MCFIQNHIFVVPMRLNQSVECVVHKATISGCPADKKPLNFPDGKSGFQDFFPFPVRTEKLFSDSVHPFPALFIRFSGFFSFPVQSGKQLSAGKFNPAPGRPSCLGLTCFHRRLDCSSTARPRVYSQRRI